MKKLSVCMIVRDEERNLRKLLPWVASLADEIIVVDWMLFDRVEDMMAVMHAAS